MKLTFDEHTRQTVIGALRASNDWPNAWANSLGDSPEFEIESEMAGRMLWFTLSILCDGESRVPDAAEGTSEWFFGRLANHEPATNLLRQIDTYQPRSFNPFDRGN